MTDAYRYVYPQPPPRRQAGSRKARIQDGLLDEIVPRRAVGPVRTTGRNLFYRLEARGIIEKQWLDANGKPRPRQPHQDVSEVLTDLRNTGVVGMDEIVDRSRSVLDFTGWPTIEQAVLEEAKSARLDPWHGDWPFLVVESDSLAGVLEPVAHEFRVKLVSLHGQASTGLLGGEMPHHVSDGTRVLYVGDLDRSGDDIEASARARIEAYARVRLDWRRIALTEEQAARYDLPEILKLDKRDKRWLPAIEAEALDERILVELVRTELEALLPRPLAETEKQEKAEREHVLERLGSGASA